MFRKYTLGSKTLYEILNNKRCVFDKMGLGYKPHIHEKYFKKYFVKASSSSSPSIVCNFCNKYGHYSHACKLNKDNTTTKLIWVPKGTNTNPKGPKNI